MCAINWDIQLTYGRPILGIRNNKIALTFTGMQAWTIKIFFFNIWTHLNSKLYINAPKLLILLKILCGKGGFVAQLVASKVICQHNVTLSYFPWNNFWNKKNELR